MTCLKNSFCESAALKTKMKIVNIKIHVVASEIQFINLVV